MSFLKGLYVFGSVARGDSDAHSDVDLLAIYEEEAREVDRSIIRHFATTAYGPRAVLAEYSVLRIKQMFERGHLFAWHLFQDAKALPAPEFGLAHSPTFSKPMAYTSGREDAMRFIGLLESIKAEVGGQPASLTHEAGLAYVALRNIAMSLSPAVLSMVDFTRRSPFSLSTAIAIPPPCTSTTYDLLVASRHASQRGADAPSWHSLALQDYLNSCTTWARKTMEHFDEY